MAAELPLSKLPGPPAEERADAILALFVKHNLDCANKPLTARVFDEVVRPMLPQLTRVLQAQVRDEPQDVQDGVMGRFEPFLERVLTAASE